MRMAKLPRASQRGAAPQPNFADHSLPASFSARRAVGIKRGNLAVADLAV